MDVSDKEKEEIKKKYEGIHSQEVLNYLKRHFPVYGFGFKFDNFPSKQIYVNDKLYMMEGNKKFLVNKISSYLEDHFPSIEKSTLRRTVKYYLDILK